jgi:hypothetical protein
MASQALSPQVASALAKLGTDLRTARQRRGESLRAWAVRMAVSVPTIRRMEAGDAKVGMGVYATALWLIGKTTDLKNIADPAKDAQALALEILKTDRRRK